MFHPRTPMHVPISLRGHPRSRLGVTSLHTSHTQMIWGSLLLLLLLAVGGGIFLSKFLFIVLVVAVVAAWAAAETTVTH